MEAIFKRKSVRKYEDRAVEKEKIEKLLRAIMQAPSAVNQQPWEVIVIENKETLKKLSEMSPYSKMVADSPVTFILAANKNNLKVPSAWQQDMGAATQNLLLEAVELELGGVWLGTATSDDTMEFVRKLFDLPENILPFSVVPIGYPDQQNSDVIDRFNKEKVHYEGWK
ncbi:FMN reductase [Clostridium puniceum]|uniref:FMN reductase n=1 Tax=Clostridium puniceum TaxID=29367 RepID=A0A1S8TNM8_9CLOT|nr:nitroreductase family protein [Clostridium puniceum]OOM79276.1 FMN reductase [Clostridium puniceum]